MNGLDPTGEDLAWLVTTPDGQTSFSDDKRDRGTPGEVPVPAAPTESVPLGSPATSLANESSRGVLHGKGGWRDHTDGNRITTTRGDKIEVIRGNYKMIILGRQDLGTDPKGDYYFDEYATGIDESGGLADNADQSRSVNGVLDQSYTWQQNSDGRWGWTQVTRTGSFDTKAKPSTQGNGRQVSFTWVDEIWTYVGSPEPEVSTDPKTKPVILPVDEKKVPKPVKKMFSETWAETIVQTVNAVGISSGLADWSDDGSILVEGTVIDPNSTPSMPASITSTTVCAGDITNVSRSFGKTETTTKAVGGITNTVYSGAQLHNDNFAKGLLQNNSGSDILQIDYTHTPFHIMFELSAILLDVKPFFHLDVHGIHFDTHLTHNDLHLGPHFTLDLMGATQISSATIIKVTDGKAEISPWYMLL
jgi:hypothetical protein